MQHRPHIPLLHHNGTFWHAPPRKPLQKHSGQRPCGAESAGPCVDKPEAEAAVSVSTAAEDEAGSAAVAAALFACR